MNATDDINFESKHIAAAARDRKTDRFVYDGIMIVISYERVEVLTAPRMWIVIHRASSERSILIDSREQRADI